MQVVSTVARLRETLRPVRGRGETIGLVPTMGFLHDGHMTLAARAKRENGCAVLSIFVNPTQFGPNEDFSSYPRDLDRDLALCRSGGIDAVFAPDVAEMYPQTPDTFVEVPSLGTILLGAQRPGHFRGVATVVAKLLAIVEPDRAYFGRKDFQQLALVRRMARDLSMRAEIVGVETVREPDGLAASSRNVRLSPEGRAAAPAIRRALVEAAKRAAAGEAEGAAILDVARRRLAAEPRVALASLDLCDAETLAPLSALDPARAAVLLVAARVDGVLLIDECEIPAITTGATA